MPFNETLSKCLAGRISLAGTNWPRALRSVLVGSLAGAGIVLVLEPDHTAGLPFLAAFGLWSTHIFFALLLFVGSLAAMLRLGLPDPWPAVISTLILPALFAPISLVLDVGFGKPDEELASATSVMSVYLSEVIAVVPVTLAAALVMIVFLYRDAAAREVQAGSLTAETESEPAPDLSDLIDAIPRSLGNDIIRMHAQDHYVEVVTAEGRALVLERLSDCVAKLEDFQGIQCHRSHWISLRHVKGLSASGSAYVCKLSNGDRVPVSRRRYSELKQRLGASALAGDPIAAHK